MCMCMHMYVRCEWCHCVPSVCSVGRIGHTFLVCIYMWIRERRGQRIMHAGDDRTREKVWIGPAGRHAHPPHGGGRRRDRRSSSRRALRRAERTGVHHELYIICANIMYSKYLTLPIPRR